MSNGSITDGNGDGYRELKLRELVPTPRTDEAEAGINTFPEPEDIIALARELERESAAKDALIGKCREATPTAKAFRMSVGRANTSTQR